MNKLLKAFLIIAFSSGAYATDIQLTWNTPTLRVDGTSIGAIDHYTLYERIDNVAQTPVEITGNAYLISNAVVGIHQFTISTTEKWSDGTLLEGLQSDSISQPIDPVIKSQIGKMLITVEVIQ